jgi:hypothetical protein
LLQGSNAILLMLALYINANKCMETLTARAPVTAGFALQANFVLQLRHGLGRVPWNEPAPF